MSLWHLLLVDDSEAVLAFEKAALAGHYQVSTAVDGRDALLKVAQLKPAAVLLDLSMPGMDGDEVLARMRADPQLARIPVIIVSSEKQRAEAEKQRAETEKQRADAEKQRAETEKQRADAAEAELLQLRAQQKKS